MRRKEEKATQEKEVVQEVHLNQGPQEEVKEVTNDSIIASYEEKIAKLTKENEELVEKIKISQAELINYRKRKDEEVANTLKYANKDLILELLPTVDNFERALNKDGKEISPELSKFLSGFEMMYNSLKMTLKKFGVEEINRVGEVFDPNQEEALLTDSVMDKDDEIVLEVLLKGYRLKDRVIRPASVKINQN